MKSAEKRNAIFKLVFTCPNCGKKVLASSLQAAMFERCPSCRQHTWDVYDALMAENYQPNNSSEATKNLPTTN